MSSKSTILLTNDNEHWYNDCSEPLTGIKDAITLEFSKKNIRIDLNDNEDLVISIINPNCEIYDVLSKLAKNLEIKEQLNNAIDIISDVRSENTNMVINGDSPLITEQLRQRIKNILNSNGR